MGTHTFRLSLMFFRNLRMQFQFELRALHMFLEAFKKIITYDNKPEKLQSDNGKEFCNGLFKNYCKNISINFFTSNNNVKCSVVERFNRSLKEKMYRYFTSRRTREYINVLNDLVSSYNASYHTAIKMAPSKVNYKNQHKVFMNLYGYKSMREIFKQKLRKQSKTIEKGEKVRIEYKVNSLDKGYYPKWTDRMEVVDKVIKDINKPYYVLQGIEGKFYPEEVQKVHENLYRIEKVIKTRNRKGKKEYMVKWLGYPDDFNTWEPARSNVVLNDDQNEV